MATVTINYTVPDDKAKEFIDGLLDSAGTNAEYILFNMRLDPEVKHLNIPVEYRWTYDGSDELAGIGAGYMGICGDGMLCECD